MPNYNHDFRRNTLEEPSYLITENDQYNSTADRKYMLGLKYETNDGRTYRYIENGGTALGAGLMTQQAVVNSDWDDVVQTTGTAAAIGDTEITVAVGALPTANDWDNGWLVILDGTGIDHAYNIKSHNVPASGILVKVKIADEGGIRVATATTSEITIIKNIYKDVVVHPVTTATGMALGVPNAAIGANEFGWVQTSGPCPMRVDTSDTLTVGTDVGVPATSAVPGACDIRQSTFTAWGVTTTAVGEADGTALITLTLE